jgi:hypothetical protein
MKFKIIKIITREVIQSLGVSSSFFNVHVENLPPSAKKVKLEMIDGIRCVLVDNKVIIPMEMIQEIVVEKIVEEKTVEDKKLKSTKE